MSPAIALVASLSFLAGVLYVLGLMTWREIRKHAWKNDR